MTERLNEHHALLRPWAGRWQCRPCGFDQVKWFRTEAQAQDWCDTMIKAHNPTGLVHIRHSEIRL